MAIIFIIIGGASPTFAAIIITRYQFGKDGPDRLFEQFKLRNAKKIILLFSILLPILINLAAIIIYVMLGNLVDFSKTNLIEFIPIFISMILMNVWAEIGWRGYLLPSLEAKFKPIISALFVGSIVALWHWPLFVIKDTQILKNYGNYFVFFVLTLIGTILIAYLYNISEGNLWAPTFFHASTNASGVVLLMNLGINKFIILHRLIVILIIAIVIIIKTKGDLGFNVLKYSAHASSL